ncbi:ricin B lectin domain-containing protein [Obelidium mucronatum]|nr:ricin B lectin domain-containing protein [Obelidium mucronatum]
MQLFITLLALLATASLGRATYQTFVLYVTNPNTGQSYCLDNKASLNKNFNPVIGWPCDPSNPASNEIWYFEQNTLVNTQTGRCLDRYSGLNGNGVAVDIFDCNWTEAQQWSLNSAGQIKSGKFCLNLQLSGLKEAGYSPVIMWKCNTEWNTVWNIRGHGTSW